MREQRLHWRPTISNAPERVDYSDTLRHRVRSLEAEVARLRDERDRWRALAEAAHKEMSRSVEADDE